MDSESSLFVTDNDVWEPETWEPEDHILQYTSGLDLKDSDFGLQSDSLTPVDIAAAWELTLESPDNGFDLDGDFPGDIGGPDPDEDEAGIESAEQSGPTDEAKKRKPRRKDTGDPYRNLAIAVLQLGLEDLDSDDEGASQDSSSWVKSPDFDFWCAAASQYDPDVLRDSLEKKILAEKSRSEEEVSGEPNIEDINPRKPKKLTIDFLKRTKQGNIAENGLPVVILSFHPQYWPVKDVQLALPKVRRYTYQTGKALCVTHVGDEAGYLVSHEWVADQIAALPSRTAKKADFWGQARKLAETANSILIMDPERGGPEARLVYIPKDFPVNIVRGKPERSERSSVDRGSGLVNPQPV